ncbi:MAG: glycine zipper 2TM domain-containing protein [Pelomonas sp.]|nr:glycine zipper 2TM domain-containing protein [Burkholderiaceae bacterium]MBV8605051.1 glycine zipper 2TM domain-containing protein [Roseateles sp.]
MLVGAIAGGVAVVSIGAVGYQSLTEPRYADVLEVKTAYETVKTPEQDCKDVQVTRKAQAADDHQIAGSVIGGLLGGVLGHQVGGGNGKTLATVAGAVGGAYAGNRVEKNMQDKNTETSTQKQCKTVEKSQETIVGYDVRYRLGDKVDTVRMDHKPDSDRIPVEHGKLVLNNSGSQS